MTTVTRRSALRGLTGLALAGAMAPAFAQAAAAAPNLTPADLEVLRSRWVDALTGRHLIPASPATFTTAIAAMDRGVTRRLGLVAPTPTQFFSDRIWSTGATPTANSNAMRMNFVDLQSLAVAWATPGSVHEGSARVLATVRQGLAHLHTHVYNERTQWWGNWWSWIIGAPRPLADVMAILHAELEQSEIDAYCGAIDHFLPERDPRLQIHPDGPQESVGANRVDICQGVIVRAIVQPDTALLQAAVSALSPTWQYITEGNGFFEDGSFVQHSTIGYTGTYGLVLLGGLSRLFALLAGTTFDITDPTRTNLTSAIEGSFAPFMVNGQMMDAVRGRAVSRYQERSIDNGNQLIEATLRLAEAAQSADPATARRWRGLCLQWIRSNSSPTITDTTNIVRLALVTDLLASDVTPVADPTGPRFFPAMDRLVHRGNGNAWALCLAMCSNRIAWSEGTPDENFHAEKTSQGMTYVYLPDDDRHFDDEYWATFDLEAPPGTTVDLTPLPTNPEGEWGGSTPPNEWTGGVVFEDSALAGMHLVAPGGTGLVARKSWFVLPDLVVALGSDISTRSSAEVRTVVEHRNLGTAARTLLVDGRPVTGTTVVDGARWAHLDGVGGYLFLDDAPGLVAGVAERSGTWRRNNTYAGAGTDTVRRRQFATLAYRHGSGPDVAGSSYAYVLLPGADATTTAARAADRGVTVLRNDDAVQAVRYGAHVVAANFWKAGTVDRISAGAAVSLVARMTPGMVRASVSDPTQTQSSVSVTLTGTPVSRVKGPDAERVRLEPHGDGVRLSVDVRGTHGRSVAFSLHR